MVNKYVLKTVLTSGCLKKSCFKFPLLATAEDWTGFYYTCLYPLLVSSRFKVKPKMKLPQEKCLMSEVHCSEPRAGHRVVYPAGGVTKSPIYPRCRVSVTQYSIFV